MVLRARNLVRGRPVRVPVLARRADDRRRRVRDRLRLVGGARAPPRLLRPDALPRRRSRRRLCRPGPDPVLRLLRGDADPDLRPGRGLGRARSGEGDRHVRALHDGRVAADARCDRRVRDLSGDVPARGDRHELERLGLPRLPRRLRRESAAPAVPRLAARRVHRGAARGCGAALRRRLEGSCVRARLDRPAALPRAGRGLSGARARARRRDARVRLGSRVPPARRPRRDRLLVDGPDGPDRARDLRVERPRSRRRGAALGQPRARLGRHVPRRGDDRDAHRHRPVLGARRAREGQADPGDARDRARDVHAGRSRLVELRRRVRDPRRGLRAGMGVRGRRSGRDRPRRALRAAADLGSAPRAARQRREGGRDRPRRQRARARRPAGRHPRGALRLARRGVTSAPSRPTRRRRSSAHRAEGGLGAP